MTVVPPLYVHTVWCDDIRQEIGNKLSLMGVYGQDIVLAELPAVLPRLGHFTNISMPIDFEGQELRLRLMRDDATLMEQTIRMEGEAPKFSPDGTSCTRKAMTSGLVLQALEIPAGCKFLQVVVQIGEHTLEGNKLTVKVDPQAVAAIMGMTPTAVEADTLPE